MAARAVLRNLKGSQQKANLVLDEIRGKPLTQAASILKFSNKKVAGHIGKLLTSAVSNLKNKDSAVDENELFVKTAFADGGRITKRYRPRAQGRATMVRKRSCHISLEVDKLNKGDVDGSKS